MRRVVITGMGIYSCIGKNLSEVTDSLYNGKSGIGIDPQRTDENVSACLNKENMPIWQVWKPSKMQVSMKHSWKRTK